MDFIKYAGIYRDHLFGDVIPFWLRYSGDRQYGGYFTCLDREGNVFDTDKFIWLQCRQVWTFSMLYNRVGKKQEWLDFAVRGADFLQAHGRDSEGNWYFSLTREGKPLTQPYSIFSDCFAAMAFGQLYQATGKQTYRDIAVKTFENILKRRKYPKGQYSKAFPGTRPLQDLSLPMILANLVLEIEDILDPALAGQTIREGIRIVMEEFYQRDRGVILEKVLPGGGFSDSFEGRLLNPGHGLETMWFMMDLAERTGDAALMSKTVDISLSLMEKGWDNEYGGIFYFLDIKGYPPQQLEWDQKLWWVHLEGLVCMLKGYLHTGNAGCWQWFERLHAYSWEHFADPEHGEWYGYLNRQGKVLLPLKGGKWKGCFHVPRGLFQAWQTLNRLEKKYQHMLNK